MKSEIQLSWETVHSSQEKYDPKVRNQFLVSLDFYLKTAPLPARAKGCWQEWKTGPREVGVGQLEEGPEGEEKLVSCWWLETELLSFSHSEVRRGFSCVAELFTVAMK